MVLLKDVSDQHRYGVANTLYPPPGTLSLVCRNIVKNIVEKPKKIIQGGYAVPGLYFYPADVYKKVKNIKPSDRGELEITDINNSYAYSQRLHGLHAKFTWMDAG